MTFVINPMADTPGANITDIRLKLVLKLNRDTQAMGGDLCCRPVEA